MNTNARPAGQPQPTPSWASKECLQPLLRVDKPPQTFVENIYLAREEDFVSATQRLYRSERYPSKIEVMVLPGGGS